MKYLALIAALALGACSTISTDAVKVEKKIDQGVAKADAFVVAKIKPSVDKADSWLVATLGPPLDKATHWFFCNKYAASSCAGK